MFEAVLNLSDSRFDNLSNMPDLKKILGMSDQEFKNQIYEMRNRKKQGQEPIGDGIDVLIKEKPLNQMSKEELIQKLDNISQQYEKHLEREL